MQKIGAALDRMSELAILAQDVTKTDNDRGLYNQEFQTLASYVTDVVAKDFNGVSLFSSSALNVTSDADGGTVEMQGIEAELPRRGDHPERTGPATANHYLGRVDPRLHPRWLSVRPGSLDDLSDGGFAAQSLSWFVSTLDFALANAGGGSASYDSGTGELSVTLGADQILYTQSGDDVFSGLGFSPSDLDNTGGGSPKTVSVTLSIPGPSTPSDAPDISTLEGAASALTTVKSAINQLATDRATVGANIARLSLTSEQLGTLKDNLTAANSRIKDVDVAQESTEFARYNILVQAGTAMLSQANTVPQSVLRLLG